MAWGIFHDHIWRPEDGGSSRVGYSEGHMRIPAIAAAAGYESPELPNTDENGRALKLIDFRLYDDDGELYYEGRLHDDDECLNQSAALKYGEGDAGCTTIKVKRAGKGWIQEIG